MLSKDFTIFTNHAFPPIGAGGLRCEGAHSECFGAVKLYLRKFRVVFQILLRWPESGEVRASRVHERFGGFWWVVLGANVAPVQVAPTDGRLTGLVVGVTRGRRVTGRLFLIRSGESWF